MNSMKVTIVDYGMGNIWSVKNALEFVGANVSICSDPDVISQSDCLILPGVGAFGPAMKNIRTKNLDQALEHAVLNRGVGILGICLGMQLLANSSEESADISGLGWIPGKVEKLNDEVRLPHIGFNATYPKEQKSPIYSNIKSGADFYFVHSYHFHSDTEENVLSTTEYGQEFVSSVQKNNIVGVQFHPEKSQSNGLQLLSNFLKFSKTC